MVTHNVLPSSNDNESPPLRPSNKIFLDAVAAVVVVDDDVDTVAFCTSL
jgi:hypothetical protein